MTNARRLWVFETGRGRVPQSLIEQGASRKPGRVPVLCFVVEHPTRGPVLVDTGLGQAMLRFLERRRGRLTSRLLGMTLDPESTCPARLLQCGYQPAQVKWGVLTHMHYDHTGALAELSATRFLVSEREYRHARRQPKWRGLGAGYLRSDYVGLTNLEPFDWTPASGLAPFGEGHDMFGDGCIRLIPTPGHSPGHLSVVVSMANGPILLAGDAAWTVRQVAGRAGLGPIPRQVAHRTDQALNSLDALRHLVRRHIGMRVLTSHDPGLGAQCADGPLLIEA